jgi:hypothetical protein
MCEAGSLTLDHRRLLIIAKTAMTLNEHPIKSKLKDPTIYDQYSLRIRIRKSFHIRAMDAAATLNIDYYQRIRQYYTSLHPPWILKQIRPDTEMMSCRPNDNNDVKNAAFKELVDRKYRYYQHTYTDGSKMDEKTGYPVVTPNQTFLRHFCLLKRKLKSDERSSPIHSALSRSLNPCT